MQVLRQLNQNNDNDPLDFGVPKVHEKVTLLGAPIENQSQHQSVTKCKEATSGICSSSFMHSHTKNNVRTSNDSYYTVSRLPDEGF